MPSRALPALVLLLAAPAVLAQADDDVPAQGPRYIVKDVTILDVEEDVQVTADVVRPTGVLVGEARRAGFEPMIDLRLDFREEIESSVDSVR